VALIERFRDPGRFGSAKSQGPSAAFYFLAFSAWAGATL
jgi:hypothetical protein